MAPQYWQGRSCAEDGFLGSHLPQRTPAELHYLSPWANPHDPVTDSVPRTMVSDTFEGLSTSPLARLPPEVRVIIWAFYFQLHTRRVTVCYRGGCLAFYPTKPYIKALGILRTCRQLYYEASPVLLPNITVEVIASKRPVQQHSLCTSGMPVAQLQHVVMPHERCIAYHTRGFLRHAPRLRSLTFLSGQKEINARTDFGGLCVKQWLQSVLSPESTVRNHLLHQVAQLLKDYDIGRGEMVHALENGAAQPCVELVVDLMIVDTNLAVPRDASPRDLECLSAKYVTKVEDGGVLRYCVLSRKFSWSLAGWTARARLSPLRNPLRAPLRARIGRIKWSADGFATSR